MNFRISSLPRFSPETPGVVPGISQLTLSERLAKAVFISPLPNAAQVCVTKDFFCSLVMMMLSFIQCSRSGLVCSYRLKERTYKVLEFEVEFGDYAVGAAGQAYAGAEAVFDAAG